MNRRPALTAATLAALALAAANLAGCYAQGTYTDGRSPIKSSDPNKGSFDDLVVETMTWAGVRYGFFPPDDSVTGTVPFALSLPGRVSRETWLDICDRIGPECFPVSPETRDLPYFHIAEVRARGGRAEVDLYRPVVQVGGVAVDEPVHQLVTVTLEGGVQEWRVERHRSWSLEPIPSPVVNEIPLPPPPPAEPTS